MATHAIFTCLAVVSICLHSTSAVSHRRILHHPLFPLDSHPPAPSPQPTASVHHAPSPPSAHPLSSTLSGGSVAPSASTATANSENPFFPTYPNLTPPPPSDTSSSSSSAGSGGGGVGSSLPTFPANISSLVVPRSRTSSSSSHSATSPKLIAIAVVLCLVVVSVLASLAFLRLRHRHRRDRRQLLFKRPPPPPEQIPHSDSAVLFPPHSATSDGRPPKLPHRAGVSTASSEFLYLGTLAGSNSNEFEPPLQLESPEIRPLPPLRPLHNQNLLSNSDSDATGDDEDDEFYSPTNSTGRVEILRASSSRGASEALARIEAFQSEAKIPKFPSYPDSSSSSPGNSAHSGPSVLVNSASDSSNSCSPEYIIRPPPLIHRVPPPPPPPPPPGRGPFTEPPILPQPSRSVLGFKSGEQQQQLQNPQPPPWNRDGNERTDEIRKPKLKGLHWDKVRASSDRVMVWDQLEAGSFALNEEMMETLFTANTNTTAMGAKDLPRRSVMPMMSQEYRVLDPKKSQNIAILLRALNVTVEEVCDSLLEGNADMLGTELLESLLKMTPTQEEERKLRDYKDESPLKLGPAEKFLKAVLDIPFAFKRVDALLYIANFDSEVEYLRKSFEALEVACEELRNSRMFLKLLEAVLKTGNRMNVGTNRGDAQAFKLDTLLKLVDVKGTDGKTTLLHFVVQEIIKAEGNRPSEPEGENSQAASSSLHDDMETKKRGLQIVASLCGELTNVKKAAAMDSDVLPNDVKKLIKEIEKVEEVAKLNAETGIPNDTHRTRFADSMSVFLKKAGGEITRIQALESASLSKVKELTEYFHGNSAKEEAHPLRIFMVVRDFLSILDKVCKEVAKVNERTIISSNRQCTMPVNPMLPQLFPDHNNEARQDDERTLLS